MRSLFAALVALAASASAHTIFQEFYVNGVSQGLGTGLRMPTYDGPITDVTSIDMTCNGGPNPLVMVSNVAITVAAGTEVSLRWGQFVEEGSPVVDPSHLGPLMVYMAQVPNAVTATPPTAGWFKIYEDGLDGTEWAVTKLIANNGILTVTIPACIPAGNYLFRGELLALHAAETYPGAQFYMECAQLIVTGGGSASPATVSIPGAYLPTDPGVTYNLYNGTTSYFIPGPAVFAC